MNAIHLAEELECELRAVGDEERAVGAKAYLKSDLEFIGVAAKPLRTVAREFLERYPGINHSELTDLVRALWEQPVFEMRAVAVALLERRIRSLETADLNLVEELLRRSHTWALVDWLCTKVAAPLVESDPESTFQILELWSIDDDFWLRRASMLAQLPALRSGGGDFDRLFFFDKFF